MPKAKDKPYVTKEQFVWETFTSGVGGQHVGRPDSSVKVRHIPSGATGSSRIHRSHLQNREAALLALSETQEYKDWAAAQEAKLKESK